jgi:hypothetical protein
MVVYDSARSSMKRVRLCGSAAVCNSMRQSVWLYVAVQQCAAVGQCVAVAQQCAAVRAAVCGSPGSERDSVWQYALRIYTQMIHSQ